MQNPGPPGRPGASYLGMPRTSRVLVVLSVACAALILAGAVAMHPMPGRPHALVTGHGHAAVAAAPEPVLAVIGASFSAGVGAGPGGHGWPADLAAQLGMRLRLSADPGAGYVRPGNGHRGPFLRLMDRLHLARLHPAIVIIQGGHDDIGRPLGLIGRHVRTLVDTVHAEAPHARIAVLSVFVTGNRASRPARATDRAIVRSARRADPHVIVFDPLVGHWRFPHIGDHLHPTAAGHLWIADRLAKRLRPLTQLRTDIRS